LNLFLQTIYYVITNIISLYICYIYKACESRVPPYRYSDILTVSFMIRPQRLQRVMSSVAWVRNCHSRNLRCMFCKFPSHTNSSRMWETMMKIS